MPFVLPLAVSVYGAVGSPRWIGQAAGVAAHASTTLIWFPSAAIT
jgi:hypothetical protein